ncbi:hypothetical protein ACFLYB_05315 [Chloroflexota bacterium]
MIEGVFILLLCGMAALLGVFLPWSNTASISGWEGLQDIGISIDLETIEVFLILIGSILVIIFSLSAAIVSRSPNSSQLVRNLCILATIGAAVAVGGASWWFSLLINWESVDIAGYGFYLSFVASVLGFIIGITTSLIAQRASIR